MGGALMGISTGGGADPARLRDTTHSPVGLYQLDGDVLDASGNGFDLTVGGVAGGTERYAPGIAPGIQAFYFDGATYLTRVHTAALAITGAVTVVCQLYLIEQPTAGQFVMYCGRGIAGADNMLHNTILNVGTSFFGNFEQGAQVPVDVIPVPDQAVPLSQWVDVAYTRSAGGTNKIYIAGTEVHSGAEGNPTGGASATFALGAADSLGVGSSFGKFLMQSAAIYASELSAANILALARRTTPPEFRP